MNHPRLASMCALCAVLVAFGISTSFGQGESPLTLDRGDHVTIIGNTLADRMQHHGWLETMIHSRFPEHELVFRNLGFAGDEVVQRPRSQNFGSPDQWITKTEADVVFCFFGYNEALRGEGQLPKFKKDLAGMLDGMLKQKYNGASPPRIVVFSPIAHEDLDSPHLPDGSENNANLALYTEAMAEVCAEKGVRFVDLFAPTRALYEADAEPLTMNGVHLLERGNRALAEIIDETLFGPRLVRDDETQLERLRSAILDRNLYWFSRYRVVDGYNVYGGRSKLSWFGQSNADVMRREMEVFDVMTANRDERVWAVAKGGELAVKDDNLPEFLEVKTNRPGPLDDGGYPYLDGEDAIEKMTVHPGMKVNLFADETRFPEVINPVQMAVDTDSRLWVASWPSYPHWKPTDPREDKLVILPDDNGDGVADKAIVFADKMNSITGFEFWGGGVLVFAPPELWFLKDTDGDDKADYRLRILQGVSSADTHHSANACVIGPDGWLYWSRGIFNVTNMETPTTIYRSSKSGVHRFNPRTFEVEFHFPIGPNPHGDVFDRWGYQFANDGTGGTGCYVNIGKGIGNKQWFKKRVRPVPATGLLSSSHFPEEFQGNFLICNCIGFLGVLQHEVSYDGADIRAEEITPILFSSDGNFRPTDLEVGGDGALYVSDWHNALIGHMQHNIRDPNRDQAHGRIYRVTYEGRPLLKPAKMKGKPVAEVCESFFAPENGTRYRARLELSGRSTDEALFGVAEFARQLDPRNAPVDRDEAQALLECLWVFEEHRVPNLDLVQKVFQADEPRVRAAAIRTLGHWAGKVEGWEPTLLAAAQDDEPLVRAEAVKAAVELQGVFAAQAVCEVAIRPVDPELETVLKYARGALNIDAIVKEAVSSGGAVSDAMQIYMLRNASVAELVKLEPSEAVYLAILSRGTASPEQLQYAISGLAEARRADRVDLLLDLIADEDERQESAIAAGAGGLLLEEPRSVLQRVKDRLITLATTANTPAARQLAFAGWITADRSGEAAFEVTVKRPELLGDVLSSLPRLRDDAVRSSLYPLVQRVMMRDAGSEAGGAPVGEPGLTVDYYRPRVRDAAIASYEGREPDATGIASDVSLATDVIANRDDFSLRFTGSVSVTDGGDYTFYLTSDDGSRLYIDGDEIINNDGMHGLAEKSGRVSLSPGGHSIVVTYFDNGGGDGLSLAWSGPGISGKKAIPGERFSTGGGQTIVDVAVVAAAALPGSEPQKFRDFASLVKSRQAVGSAVTALRSIEATHWDGRLIPSLIDNLVAELSQMPARQRTGPVALEMIALANDLTAKLTKERAAAIRERLKNLDVRVIAIGTVPQRMMYDVDRVVVEAGTPVEFRFSNTDAMPHNLTVALPGSMEEVGLLAEETAQQADAQDRNYVPRSDKIIVASRLLQPGDSQAISFEAPKKPGVYPIICTYPGHWRRMFAALYVTESLAPFDQDPEAFYASAAPQIQDELLTLIGKEREWKVDDLLARVKPLEGPREFAVGKAAFKVSSCISCHQIGASEGLQVGPELTKLDATKDAEHILRSIIHPSEKIEEKYQSNIFELVNGKVVTGMIVEETDDVVKVIENPLASTKPIVIDKEDIDYQEKSTKSLMPEGLAGKLTEEEFLDLIAYVFAKGDPKHPLFEGGCCDVMPGHEMPAEDREK